MQKKAKYSAAAVILVVLFIFNFTVSAASGENPGANTSANDVSVHINIDGLSEPPDITAAAAILMDAETGELIYEKNSGKIIFPASAVKMMTAIVVLENIEDLDSQVAISRYVKQNTMGNSLPDVSEGEIFTVEDLLHALLLRGANDAALALAEYVAGTVTAFVDKMNLKAHELGCANTVFTNPTGMHSSDMYTTASDISKIAFYASKIQKLIDISSAPKYEIEPTNTLRTPRTLLNHNHFISKGRYSQYYYEHARGINFGSTTEAGFCLTTIAEQSGLSYLGIIMGSTAVTVPGTDNLRINCFSDARSLFEWIFSLYSYRTVVSSANLIESVEVSLAANRDVITLVPDAEIQVLLPKNADIDTEVIIDHEIFEELLVAPIEKFQILGKITVMYDGEIVGTANLISNSDVEPSGVLYALEWIKEVVSGVWFRASVIIFVVIFAFYTAVLLLRKGRTEHRRFH